jgi:hypothetical protein
MPINRKKVLGFLTFSVRVRLHVASRQSSAQPPHPVRRSLRTRRAMPQPRRDHPRDRRSSHRLCGRELNVVGSDMRNFRSSAGKATRGSSRVSASYLLDNRCWANYLAARGSIAVTDDATAPALMRAMRPLMTGASTRTLKTNTDERQRTATEVCLLPATFPAKHAFKACTRQRVIQRVNRSRDFVTPGVH